MSSNEHPQGIETRGVASGYQAVVHHGDGSCTKTWAATEDGAERRAQEIVTNE